MKIKITKKVKEIIEKFEKNGFEIYIVGGAVRDIIMGKVVYDWDFATNITPESILKLFSNAYYDNEFGTVGIKAGKNKRPFEITTFRKEFGYSDLRRPDLIEWGKSLEEDLKRRDFTINAMAFKILKIFTTTDKDIDSYEAEVKLIDLYAGQENINQKLIRAVGNPNERFSEDALRMMRAVRIASELNFNIEENTFNAIKMNSHLIQKISKERVRDELLKILSSPHPYEGIVLLKDSGLMKEILPEMQACFGVEQKSPGRHHIYDVGTHSLLSLKYVSERTNDPIVRFATLIHDIGKPPTYKKLENGVITFYNHEVVGSKIAKRIADRLKLSNLQKDKLWRLVRYHQFSVDEKQTDSAIRRFIRKVGLKNIPDILNLRIGDRLGGGARETSWRLEEFKKRLVEVQKQPFTVKDLKVDGYDVMRILNIKPSPKVGEVLNQLFNEVVEKRIENKREVLLERLKELKTL